MLLPAYRPIKILLLFAAVLLLPAVAASNPVATPHVNAQLISEGTAIQPGTPFWVAVRLQMIPGWHTYWRNPGDSGMATTVNWTLPNGFTAGEMQWPYPERIPTGPLLNYGYHGEVLLLTQISPPTTLDTSTAVPLTVHAKWLVCEEHCIPEDAVLTLTLPVSATVPPTASEWAPAFERTRQALPRPAPWPVDFTTTPDRIDLHLPTDATDGPPINNVSYFPYADGVIEYAAPQTWNRTADGLQLTLQRLTSGDLAAAQLPGLVVVATDDGVNAFTIAPNARAVSAATTPAGPEAADVTALSLSSALLFALLGGVILNLMPCVFPVLSMKALSFVRHAGESPAQLRRQGLIYTAGVLAAFTVIAGALLLLRLGGAQIGWGFQLQSPLFVTLLIYLLFAMGLSLSGVYTLGGRLMGVGSGLAARSGDAGAFFTGVLATLVATPCTAPFMGTALGFALTQPWPVALAIFQALGLGLALPYLALSFSPGLARFLPRPGGWMERFRELLAFPLYLTCAWLLWVLIQQTGPASLFAALVGLILIAFAAWLFNSTRLSAPRWRLAGSTAAIATVGGALLLATAPVASVPPAGATSVQPAAAAGPVWEPFSEQRLTELRAQGRPVFLNFTAAWCITCLANERVALQSPRLAAHFAEQGIAYLKADWTRRDPEITRMLSSFGRSGVPLYVYYAPDREEPVILPQLLTESSVLAALGQPGADSGKAVACPQGAKTC